MIASISSSSTLARLGALAPRQRAQRFDVFERARARVRAQHVADEPPQERDARPQRRAGIAFDAHRLLVVRPAAFGRLHEGYSRARRAASSASVSMSSKTRGSSTATIRRRSAGVVAHAVEAVAVTERRDRAGARAGPNTTGMAESFAGSRDDDVDSAS